jgi:hypothetical protein
MLCHELTIQSVHAGVRHLPRLWKKCGSVNGKYLENQGELEDCDMYMYILCGKKKSRSTLNHPHIHVHI